MIIQTTNIQAHEYISVILKEGLGFTDEQILLYDDYYSNDKDYAEKLFTYNYFVILYPYNDNIIYTTKNVIQEKEPRIIEMADFHEQVIRVVVLTKKQDKTSLILSNTAYAQARTVRIAMLSQYSQNYQAENNIKIMPIDNIIKDRSYAEDGNMYRYEIDFRINFCTKYQEEVGIITDIMLTEYESIK